MRAAWWWIDRWRTSGAYASLSMAEQGAYRNLLDELWLRDGLLPPDDRSLERASGAGSEWPKLRTNVLKQFRKVDDGYRHDVHDEVQAESRSRAERQKRYRDKKGSVSRNVTVNATDNRGTNVYPSPSLSLDQDQEPSQTTEQTILTGEAPARSVVKAKPVVGPQDAAARRLATALGSSLNPCRKQVAALIARGVTLDSIDAAVVRFAEPGMAPWDWTKKVTGTGSASAQALTGDQIREIARRQREQESA